AGADKIAIGISTDHAEISGVRSASPSVNGEIHRISSGKHQPLIEISVDNIVTDATDAHAKCLSRLS
ncbi:MAG: hypothetical protein J0H31_08850, partial [Alphaproteobacteria bacterium]|nr:hypothetical protein [Alphaproteobacteria bacterium]